MMVPTSLILSTLLAVSQVSALPTPEWKASEYTIHDSCNATETLQLRRGLNEMLTLAEHARAHILQHGNSSEIYQKYFGNASTAEPIGWFDRILYANRSDVLFRCDDPDQNCATQNNWAGHWRGSNATQETVICERSFAVRKNLESMCALGYTVSAFPTNFYFASDLLHRIFHVPRISEGIVEHYAEDYPEVLSLAQTDSSLSVRDSDTLQCFALEVFSYAVVPGVGCPGNETETSTSVTPSPTATPTSAVVASVTSGATAVSFDPALFKAFSGLLVTVSLIL